METKKGIAGVVLIFSAIVLLVLSSFMLGASYNFRASSPSGAYNVMFNDNVITKLNTRFTETGGNEFAVCLIGTIDNNNVLVTDVNKFVIGDKSMVNGKVCDGINEVGLLHKHPEGTNLHSFNDVYDAYLRFKHSDNIIYVIMYDLDKFTIIDKNNWRTGYSYEV